MLFHLLSNAVSYAAGWRSARGDGRRDQEAEIRVRTRRRHSAEHLPTFSTGSIACAGGGAGVAEKGSGWGSVSCVVVRAHADR